MKKNKILFPKKVALLLGAAAVLLLGSTVGSTRAALTYYSENYSAQMNLKHIGVSLVENGQVVSSRDYVSGNEWSGNTCLLYTSPSPRDVEESRMPSSA